ncbi:MAG: PEP-CTERM sorting domain-containing protein [Planctomycetes bacterium]|nr:PEP-CTERM sorting domain-containing protein [Planctomycetota bacterium]
MNYRFLLAIALVALLPSAVTFAAGGSTVFFSEDFESYALDPDVAGTFNPGTGTPWTISNTAATVETEGQWYLVDTKSTATAFGLPSEVNFGPATVGGTTTPGYDPTGAAPGGRFMISRADGIPPVVLPGSGFPTLPGGSVPLDPQLPGGTEYENRIDNGTYTGASNDIITPSFSTAGATGNVWLSASISANLNDGGQAIFDIDVSTDGGVTWVNRLRRIAPGSGRDIANGDFDSDLDVDGADFLSQQRLMNFADCLTCGPGGSASVDPHDLDSNRRPTDQRFSDWEKAFQGVYTPVVATTAAKNAGGLHGELGLDLGNLGGATDVRVRFRQFESRDDEFIAIDNVVVSEVAPPGSASVTIFSEDFNDLLTLGSAGFGLGQMGVYEFTDPTTFLFGNDLGGGGSRSGFSWGAQDRTTISYSDEGSDGSIDPLQGPPVLNTTGRYDVGVVGNKNVNNLGHPVAEGPNGEVPFAIIDPQSEIQVPGGGGSRQSERMYTPVFDLTAYDTVILEWEDETIFDGTPFAGSVASVVVMLDDDLTPGPSNGDTILNEPDKLAGTYDPYLPYDQFAGGAFAGGDDPIFERRRIDVTASAAGVSNVYFAWQFRSERTDYWAVDNILVTGELSGAAFAVPEPSSLLLAVLGIPAFASVRRRRRVR